VHPLLAVAPRFDGGNWTMAFIGMNTDLDASTLPTKPRHLILVGDPSFTLVYENIAEALGDEDRVSVITVDDGVKVALEAEPVDALTDLPSPQPVDPDDDDTAEPYGALVEALRMISNEASQGFAHRVLLFGGSQGFGPSEEIAPYEDLALAFAEEDTAISVYTDEPDEVSHVLVDITSGNHYFVADEADLGEALAAEAATAFVPIARHLKLTVEAASGYRIGRVFGAPRARVEDDTAVLESPVAYIGARTSSDDASQGRRGGGGGWFVQLLSDRPATGQDYEDADVFTLSVEYDDAISGEAVRTESTLVTPLGVGQNPPPQAPFFSDTERGKSIMMLNMYLAQFTTTMLASENQCGAALAIEPMMTEAWEIFTELYPDPDIDADFNLLKSLTNNIEASCREPVASEVNVPMSCGYI
jgi:Ca-activated chloride channel family protein